MDALSKILDDIHLNRSEYLYLNTHGDWAFRMQQQPAVLAYIVLSGELYLHLDQSASTRPDPSTTPHPDQRLNLHATAGDILMLPAGQAHRCSPFASPDQLIETVDISSMFAGTKQDVLYIGTDHSDLPIAAQTAPDRTTDTATGASTDQLHAPASHNLIMAIRCQIDTIMAKPLLNALPEYLHLHNLLNHRAPEWLQIGLSFLAQETLHVLPGRDKIIDHLISILFIECVRDYILSIEDSQNWLNALSHPQLSNALTAIHTQPAFAWTVESLAEQCCMSRSKFASIFHELVGDTPLAYLQQHRMNLACQLLREGQLSIQQIAHQVGYSSDTTFSQSFKKRFEQSPNQYRKQYA